MGCGARVWCEVRDGAVGFVDFVDGLFEVSLGGGCACFVGLNVGRGVGVG